MRAGIVNVKGSSVTPQCEDKMPVSPSDTQEAVHASAFIPGYVWSPSLITCQWYRWLAMQLRSDTLSGTSTLL